VREPGCDTEDLEFDADFESESRSITEPEDMVRGGKVDKLLRDDREGCEDCHFVELEDANVAEPE
jgi:hypothetical protein